MAGTETEFTIDTASELAAEEGGQKIVGRSPWVLAWRRLRRNKVALTTAALMAGMLVLGTGASTWQALRATAAEGEAKPADTSAEKAAASGALRSWRAGTGARHRVVRLRR